MPQTTFDPISSAFETRPARRPGKAIVALKEGTTIEIDADGNGPKAQSVGFDWSALGSPRILAPVAVLSAALIFFLGVAGLLVGLALVAAVIGWLITNRRSTASQLLFGALPEYYLVDISRQTIHDERRTQLKETGVYVVVDFEYRATVTDPEEVVARGVHDVRAYLSDKFYRKIDACGRKGTLDDNLGALRTDLEKTLSEPLNDKLIHVESVLFDLRTEGKVGAALAKLGEEAIRKKEIDAQNNIDTVARNHLLSIISNNELLLAEMMRLEDTSRVESLLKMRMEQRNVDFQQNLSLLNTMMEHGILEPHQIKRDYPQFLNDLARTRVMPGLVGDKKAIAADGSSNGTP